MSKPELRELSTEELNLLVHIDRSERVDVQYEVVGGKLGERSVVMTNVPGWFEGNGPHSVGEKIAFCRSAMDDGATTFGAFVDGALAGVAIVNPRLEGSMAWFAFLHVSRAYRGSGVATTLWDAGIELAIESGSTWIYVSATPTGSAVGFYTSRGCVLADPVHPRLFEDEPEDIHLTCSLV